MMYRFTRLPRAMARSLVSSPASMDWAAASMVRYRVMPWFPLPVAVITGRGTPLIRA